MGGQGKENAPLLREQQRMALASKSTRATAVVVNSTPALAIRETNEGKSYYTIYPVGPTKKGGQVGRLQS